MEANLYLDIQMIQDGSARWLWMLRGDTAIYGAGVVMSRDQAQRQGEQCLVDLGQKEHARRHITRDEGWKTEMLDTTLLEAGSDQDAARVRREREQLEKHRKDRGDGHTEESDPAGLGGL